MIMIEEFINENFITPLCRYYTPIGTLTYGLALAVVIFLTYKLLIKMKIKIDRRFFVGLLPFIIYGGWTRALRDYSLGVYESNLFCSPPIYFFIFAVTLTTIVAGVLIEKKTKKRIGYEKVMLVVGTALLLYDLSLTRITNLTGFGIIAGLALAWTAIFLTINKLRPKLLSLQNAAILSTHLLDASATFTALTFYNFYEQHVLPSFLIEMLGPWVMFPLKIAVVWTVLVIIDKSKEDVFLKNMLKIAILTLGLALGIRDFMTISML
jgi:uncharacterized membrane protein